MPEFDETTGCLPPGRYRVTPEQAFEMLVKAERFAKSSTRPQLWDGFERYMARFFALEDMHPDLASDTQLVHCLWLGGSYVSTELDPDGIDLTVFIDDEAARAYRGRLGAGWIRDAFDRAKIKSDFGLSPVRVTYRPITSAFQPEKSTPEDESYLRDRGAWDDWWQRRDQRDAEQTASPRELARPARGYLEVTP